MLNGIDHIDIVVEDPEQMATFLGGLGFVEVRRTSAARGSIELRFPGEGNQPLIELTPARRADGSTLKTGLRHMALRCSNLEDLRTLLKQQGIAFTSEPRVVGDTGRLLANILDIEGNTLQFVQPQGQP